MTRPTARQVERVAQAALWPALGTTVLAPIVGAFGVPGTGPVFAVAVCASLAVLVVGAVAANVDARTRPTPADTAHARLVALDRDAMRQVAPPSPFPHSSVVLKGSPEHAALIRDRDHLRRLAVAKARRKAADRRAVIRDRAHARRRARTTVLWSEVAVIRRRDARAMEVRR